MARSAKYTDQQVLEAAHTLVSQHGPRAVTIVAIAKQIKAPTGSIYHRFRSRELILAHVLLDVAEAYQTDLGKLIRDPSVQPGDIAQHVVQWIQQYPDKARLLALYRREEYLSGDIPAELSKRASQLQADLLKALQQLSKRWLNAAGPAELEAVSLAIADIPYGAVRRRLARREPIPPSISIMVAAAAEAVIAKAQENNA